MAGAKKQTKRQNAAPRTPKKPKPPARPTLIGSGSTWTHEELDRLKVRAEEVDPKRMIPEKWFDFNSLEPYERGNIPINSTHNSAQLPSFK